MKNRIYKYLYQDKFKTLLLLVGYVIFSEIIKNEGGVYILEQSLEIKLLLLSAATVLMYNVPENLIISSIAIFLLLSFVGVQTGFMIYVFVFYSFVRLLRMAKKSSK